MRAYIDMISSTFQQLPFTTIQCLMTYHTISVLNMIIFHVVTVLYLLIHDGRADHPEIMIVQVFWNFCAFHRYFSTLVFHTQMCSHAHMRFCSNKREQYSAKNLPLTHLQKIQIPLCLLLMFNWSESYMKQGVLF